MKLYHNPISTCSQKVRLVLCEKGIEVDDALLDLQRGDQFDSTYLKLNPNGVVPTLEHAGSVMTESTLINEYIDDAFPAPSLRPAAATGRHRMRLMTKRVDDALHGACGVLTYAIGARPTLLARPEAEREAMLARIPDAVRRETRRSVIERGAEAPAFAAAMDIHHAVLDHAERGLAQSPWIAGETFSLADCALAPYVLRVDHLMLGELIEARPNLGRWYDAVRARPSWTGAVTKWLPDAVVEAFRSAGQALKAEHPRIARRLD